MEWIIGVVLIIIIFVTLFTWSKDMKSATKHLENRGYDMNFFLNKCKYLYGHPGLNEVMDGIQIYVKNDAIEIFKWTDDGASIDTNSVASILFKDVISISLEDKSTIQSRVGLKRLVLMGIFAFAVKKNEKLELNYLVIEWENQGFKNETVFEYEGHHLAPEANKARNIIQNKLIDFRKEFPIKPIDKSISLKDESFDKYKEIEKIFNLKEQGILSQEEFDVEKKKLLDQ